MPIGQPRGGREVMVSAAVSLSESIADVARAFEKQSGARIALNLGPSSTLARQIRQGARIDVFISADDDQMNVVERAGRLIPSTRTPLLSNQLVIVASADRTVTLKSPRDLLDARFRRIATGNPEAVPAGVYAKQYLESQGLWAEVAKKIVPTDGVRAALAAVEQGHADLAIVYKTDAAASRRAAVAFTVPRAGGPRIVYPAALVATGRNREDAAHFLTFLRSAPARAIFERAGFDVIATSPHD